MQCVIRAGCVMVVGIVATSGFARPVMPITRLLLTGDQISGGPGNDGSVPFQFVRADSMHSARINDIGDVAVLGQLPGSDPNGLIRIRGGVRTVAVQTGNQVSPAFTASRVTNWFALSPNGDIISPVVRADQFEGIVRIDQSVQTVLIAPGSQPGDGQTTVQWVDARLSANAAGDVAALLKPANTSPTGPREVWAIRAGTPQRIARAGYPVPGAPAGWVFSSTPQHPVMSETGLIAFAASIDRPDDGIPGGGFAIHVSRPDGSLSTIAYANGPLPGGPVDSRFTGGSSPSISRNGTVAFAGALAGSGSAPTVNGIWLYRNGTATLTFNADTAVPGGQVLTPVRGIAVNDHAGLAFIADTRLSSGARTKGLWATVAGSTQEILRFEDLAPVIPVTENVRTSGAFFPAMNNAGQIAVLTSLFGPTVTGANDYALFGWNAAGTWSLIAREGSPFEVAPGDVRTIESIFFDHGTGQRSLFENETLFNSDGGPHGLNSAGQMVFSLNFTDGTAGVFTTQVPSPSGAAVLAGLVVCTGRHRSRTIVRLCANRRLGSVLRSAD